MNQCQRFSNVTQTYLNDFERILNNMIRRIDNARLTNSISRNFISQMIPHHAAAVAMSQNILRYTTDLELQCLAETIIKQQTQGIATMRRIAGICGMQTNCRDDLARYQEKMNCILHDMFEDMKEVPSVNDVNENFLREMIPHHLGAIAMSKNALDFPICPQLVPVLENIIDTQKREVEQMRQMLGEDCECNRDRNSERDQNSERERNYDQNRSCDRDQNHERECGCQRD